MTQYKCEIRVDFNRLARWLTYTFLTGDESVPRKVNFIKFVGNPMGLEIKHP